MGFKRELGTITYDRPTLTMLDSVGPRTVWALGAPLANSESACGRELVEVRLVSEGPHCGMLGCSFISHAAFLSNTACRARAVALEQVRLVASSTSFPPGRRPCSDGPPCAGGGHRNGARHPPLHQLANLPSGPQPGAVQVGGRGVLPG